MAEVAPAGAAGERDGGSARAAASKAVLVGAGAVARQPLACLAALDGVHLAGICDLSPAVAESAAARFGVPRHFTDHRAMLAELSPGVVHVSTPPGAHYQVAMDALTAGAHAIVEKP